MSVTGRLNVMSMFKAIKHRRVIQATKLCVRTSPVEVKSYFENYGPVYQVHRHIDVSLGQYTGPAFIQFEDEKTCTNVRMQNQHFIDGKEVELFDCEYFPKDLRPFLRKSSEKQE